MKVRELREKLSKLDPELEIFCGTENSLMLEIQSVGTAEGELTRTADGTPCVKFGKSTAATAFVLLEVTSDF